MLVRFGCTCRSITVSPSIRTVAVIVAEPLSGSEMFSCTLPMSRSPEERVRFT